MYRARQSMKASCNYCKYKSSWTRFSSRQHPYSRINPSLYQFLNINKLHDTQKTSYHSTPTPSFIVDKLYNVGHGPAFKTRYPELPSISPAQRKSANVELERMKASTENIITKLSQLGNDDSLYTDVFINEIRVAAQYWVTRWTLHFHPTVTPSITNVLPIPKPRLSSKNTKNNDDTVLDDSFYGDYGSNQTIKILSCLLKTENNDLLKKVLFLEGNIIIPCLIETLLLPCTLNLTNSVDKSDKAMINHFDNAIGHVQLSSMTGFNNIKPSIWKPSILKALQVIEIMDTIQQQCDVLPDLNSYNSKFITWSKLATLLHVIDSSSSSGVKEQPIDWNEEMSNIIVDSNEFEKVVMRSKEIPSVLQFQSNDEIIAHMEKIFANIEKEYQHTKRETIKPNGEAYNVIIAALSRSSSNDAPFRAEWYLRRMEKSEDLEFNIFTGQNDENDVSQEDLVPATAFPDAYSYNFVINAYTSADVKIKHKLDIGLIQRAEKADAVLQRMEKRFKQIQRHSLKPDIFSYSSVLHGYANAGKAHEAERILKHIIDLSNTDDSIEPNIICFNTVIDAWAKTKGSSSAERAHQILNEMKNFSKTYKSLHPDTISYSSVISAYARSGSHDAGDRAEELLQESLKLYNDGKETLKPDTITFITVLSALASQGIRIYQRRKKKDMFSLAAIEDRIRSILTKMKNLEESGDNNVRQNNVAYNILLDFYAKTSQIDKAKRLLSEMKTMSSDGMQHLKPDVITYNSVLLALSRDKNRLNEAESLLHELEHSSDLDVKPDIVSYNTVINGLLKCNAPNFNERIQQLLSSIEERYQSGISEVKPNIITYNISIDAWSKSGERNAAEQAIKIIEKMLESDNEVKPDVFSLSGVISAIANGGGADAPERAMSMLNRMKDVGVKPNRINYNNILNSWAKSDRKDAPEQAESILISMTESDNPEVHPDASSFTIVINCWAQSRQKGSGERAEKILKSMEQSWKSGNTSMKPMTRTYASVLNAWLKSRDDNATQRTLEMLKHMEKEYIEGNADALPDEYCYNTGTWLFHERKVSMECVKVMLLSMSHLIIFLLQN